MEAKELEKCINVFGDDIYRFCLKICLNKDDAEDLYQQTFLKALESNFILDWDNNPKALFFSISYKIYKSNMRKWARRNNIVSIINIDEKTENILYSYENIENDVLEKNLINEITKIIDSLPEKIKVPLTLYYLFDFSTSNISKVIKKPIGTVKSRLFKGRGIIKKRLEEVGYD